MIELGIVDLSAESRRRLTAVVERWAWTPPDFKISLPRLSLHSLSPEEVRFHGGLDVCVVGPELIGCDAAFIHGIRKQLNDKVLIAVLDARTYSFGLVEQLSRLGVDDVFLDTATSEEFFRRILLLQRRFQGKKRGSLIVVDSARGGVGKTFLTATVAEGWYAHGKSVCMVDTDVLAQDLARFFKVKPHVNEPLRLLIEQQRVVTAETVAECTREVWADEKKFVCVVPPAGRDESIFMSSGAQRGVTAVLEALLLAYDKVIVDSSGLPSTSRNALFQIADEVLFVMNRDISAAFANRQALSLIAGFMRHDAVLTAVLNDTGVGAAPIALLRDEVAVIAGRQMRHVVVPRSRRGAAWVCSGYTPYRFLSRSLLEIFTDVAVSDGPSAPHARLKVLVESVWRAITRRLRWLATPIWGNTTSARQLKHGEGARSLLPAVTMPGIDPSTTDVGGLVSKPVLLG
jgi:MinD-like ATPase involved in chromosome partitioning or flagellar assembly